MFSFFLRETIEGLMIAFSAIRANKMRSILTTLGIVIGIVAVILMATAIEGLNQSFAKSISALGSDVLYIQKYPWFSSDYYRFRNRNNITLAHAEAVEKYATMAQAVAPTVGTRKTLKFRENSLEGVSITGTTVAYKETANNMPEYGRFLSETDVHASRPVAVIGTEVAEKLFENTNPLGRRFKVGGRPFRVIGILEERGNFLGMMNMDAVVIIPIGVFRKMFGTRRYLTIEVKVADQEKIEQAKDELTGIMRRVRKVPPGAEDDFSINQQSLFQNMYKSLTGAIYAAGIVITLLSLLVGGIGVMNIMLVSVTERTREIGIRKALGAKRRNIMLQFLIESSSICFAGGLIALTIGFLISLLIDKFLLPTAMPISWAAIGMTVSLLVGVTFGLFPAAKASKLDPIDALRYE